MLQVQSPFQQINDIDGSPLEAGYVYIGTTNLNPETNPISIYWDDAGTQPAAQPLRTAGGYIVHNGTPARVYTAQADYSMTVRNKKSTLVVTVASATALSNLRTDLSASFGSSLVGFIQPDAGAIAETVQTKLREGRSVTDFYANGVSGAAVDPTGVVDSTLGIQAALNTNRKVFFPKGVYRITKTLTVPVYTSISGEVGSVINADFTVTGTWAGTYVALLFLGLGGFDVATDKYNTVFENIVISSTAANTVVATGVQVSNGATSGSILEARVFSHWTNVMVVGFDTGYKLNQLSNSELNGIKARDVRVGISVIGKTVNVFMSNLNLFKGTPKTTSAATSYGIFVDSYFRPAEERPESINVCTSLVAAFDNNVYLTRALLVNLSNNVFDLGTGSTCIGMLIPRQVVISNNWLDCGTVGAGINFDAVGTPSADDLVTIIGNVFSRVVNAVAFTGRYNIHIIGNEFLGSSDNDINCLSSVNILIKDNRSKSANPLVYIQSSDFVVVADNTTNATHPIGMHPTSNGTNITIGNNVGSVQRTYVKGKATIPAATTFVDITVPIGVTGYVYPIIKILNLNTTTTYPVLEAAVTSYGATSTVIRITSSIAAPVGGFVVRYEVTGWWYGEA